MSRGCGRTDWELLDRWKNGKHAGLQWNHSTYNDGGICRNYWHKQTREFLIIRLITVGGRWLVLLPHSKKVPYSNPLASCGLPSSSPVHIHCVKSFPPPHLAILPQVHSNCVSTQKGVVHGSQQLFVIAFICKYGEQVFNSGQHIRFCLSARFLLIARHIHLCFACMSIKKPAADDAVAFSVNL